MAQVGGPSTNGNSRGRGVPRGNLVTAVDGSATLAAQELVIAALREQVSQLQTALDSRVVIEQAKGVLAARLDCTVEEAFELLRHAARSHQVRIHALAAETVVARGVPPKVERVLRTRAGASKRTAETAVSSRISGNGTSSRARATGQRGERLVEHPFIYEINTWVWLVELGRRTDGKIGLAGVPEEEWDAIAALGFDAVWLMGVWERSPAGIEIALENDGLVESFERALPDFTAEDVVGSPYCIRDYTVAAELGGADGLASAREALERRGLALILDFVPNHVAPDHAWTAAHPEYFVGGSEADLERDPASFVRSETVCLRTAATRTSRPGPTSCS